jgi:AbrB family looped-hinge helix DNA binding protein
MVAVRVDSKGRLTIPRAERERLGIKPGDVLFLRESNGALIYVKAQNPFDALAEEAIAEAEAGRIVSLRDLAARDGFDLDATNDERRFQALAEEWRRDTSLMSVVSRMVRHPAYQSIIGMGWSAVPLILRELQSKPDHWFVALSTITGEDPIPPSDAGDVRKMADAWIRWGKQRGYIPDESGPPTPSPRIKELPHSQ